MTTSPRSPAGHELGEHEHTAEPRHWIRTCEGEGPVLVGYDVAAWCLQQPGVTGTLATGLRWTAGSTQDTTRPARQFTLDPASEDEALEWIRAHGGIRSAT